VAAQRPYWTTITVNKGTHLHSMGFSHQGKVTLHAEEAAYLVARNALVVDNMDFEGFCEIMYEAGDGFINYDKYQVYAYLKRLGFIVMRAAKDDVTGAAKDSNNSSVMDHVLKWLYSKRSMDNPLLWDYKCRNYSKKKGKKGKSVWYLI
jgi:tRNA splicing endonuclease